MEKSEYIYCSCTYDHRHLRAYKTQSWAQCLECFDNENRFICACLYCLDNCHKGHKIGDIITSRFFCDCGLNKHINFNNLVENNSYQFSGDSSEDHEIVYHEIVEHETVEHEKKNQHELDVQISSPQSISIISLTHKCLPNNNLIRSCNYFADVLIQRMKRDSIFSPLSLTLILSMLHHGATGNTESQIYKLFQHKNTLEDLYAVSQYYNSDVIKMTNIIFIDKTAPIKKKYLDQMMNVALIANRDLSTEHKQSIITEINEFVKENSCHTIMNIIDTININYFSIIANCFYFKCQYDTPFNPKNNKKVLFNKSIMVQMMKQTTTCRYFEDRNVQIIKIPCNNYQFCIKIILPKTHLFFESCRIYLSHKIEYNMDEVDIRIPKFIKKKKTDLVPFLQKVGVVNKFSSLPEMDKMIHVENMNICQIINAVHETALITSQYYVEDSIEDRTESDFVYKSPPKLFYANHPFFYCIEHCETDAKIIVGDYHG